MMDSKQIALFDMDGTLCDHDKGLFLEMEKIRNPSEEKVYSLQSKQYPDYIKARADLIRQQESWWENLPKFKLGWDILKVAQKENFKIMILTQGPKTKPASWSGKMRWINKNLPGIDVTITRDKGLVYGKILVDDYPEYIVRWLEHRPRGLVIMPANELNENFSHPQVIRYDGKNLEEVRRAFKIVKKREAGEKLRL